LWGSLSNVSVLIGPIYFSCRGKIWERVEITWCGSYSSSSRVVFKGILWVLIYTLIYLLMFALLFINFLFLADKLFASFKTLRSFVSGKRAFTSARL
jgi:hypothetical protein